MKLSDYGSNVYSQTGEDGMIEEVFKRIGIGSRVCVEFGGGDGFDCSNTAKLRNEGWQGILIESDKDRYEAALKNVKFSEIVVNMKIEPSGPKSIDSILESFSVPLVDFMSIDVDGDDLWIFNQMECHPRLVLIEYNRSVPPHIDLSASGPPNNFGASALCLRKIAALHDYELIGLTESCLFFVEAENVHLFTDVEKDLSALMSPEWFTYLVTDYDGHFVPIGNPPPWGLRWPLTRTKFTSTSVLINLDVRPTLERLKYLVSEFEEPK